MVARSIAVSSDGKWKVEALTAVRVRSYLPEGGPVAENKNIRQQTHKHNTIAQNSIWLIGPSLDSEKKSAIKRYIIGLARVAHAAATAVVSSVFSPPSNCRGVVV